MTVAGQSTVSQLGLMLDPAAEAAERRAWKGSAARLKFGRCDGCGRLRDDHDKPLFVAKRERARRFLCFDCSHTRKKRS